MKEKTLRGQGKLAALLGRGRRQSAEPVKAPSWSPDPLEELREYKQLLDMGVILEDAFTAKKRELLDIEEAGPRQTPAPPVPGMPLAPLDTAPPPAPGQEAVAALMACKQLLDEGVLTREEFEKKKKQLLSL